METLLIKVKGRENSRMLSEILRSIKFVYEVVELEKMDLMEQIKMGLIQVKKIREGKLKRKSITELVNEK